MLENSAGLMVGDDSVSSPAVLQQSQGGSQLDFRIAPEVVTFATGLLTSAPV
jgi:hypothetical protein